jgi:hypothetical protein
MREPNGHTGLRIRITLMRILIQLFNLMRNRIRIMLLIKKMLICDHRPKGPFGPPRQMLNAHGPPRLHFEPLKLLNFDFNADPDPAFKNNADPDPTATVPVQSPNQNQILGIT